MQMEHAQVIIVTSDPVISQTDVSPNESVNFALKLYITVCKKSIYVMIYEDEKIPQLLWQ